MIRVGLSENGPYYLARWRSGGKTVGKSIGKRADMDRKEAEDACKRLQDQLNADPAPAIDPNPTISGWLKTFLALRPGLSERSAKLYRACTDRLALFLGPDKPLKDVTPLEAMHFRAWLASTGHLADQTAYRIMGECRAIFQCAVDGEVIPRNPWTRAMPPKPRQDQSWPEIPLSTLSRLLEVATGRWRAFLGVLAYAGLRQGEALRLEWSAVDLVARRLHVFHLGRYQTTKRRSRELPISPELYDVLWQASMESGDEQRVCGGISSGSIHREAMAICKKANIDPWDRFCHTLRKNCQTRWSRLHPLHVVASWMGNSSAVALQYYLSPVEADYLKATCAQLRPETTNSIDRQVTP